MKNFELINNDTKCSNGYSKGTYDSFISIPQDLDFERANEYPSRFELDIFLNRSHLIDRM